MNELQSLSDASRTYLYLTSRTTASIRCLSFYLYLSCEILQKLIQKSINGDPGNDRMIQSRSCSDRLSDRTSVSQNRRRQNSTRNVGSSRD